MDVVFGLTELRYNGIIKSLKGNALGPAWVFTDPQNRIFRNILAIQNYTIRPTSTESTV